jgi:penicillin-binding protein 2
MDKKFISRIYLSGFFILFLSLFYYQVIKGDYYLNHSKNNYLRTIPLSPIRGTIFDRNLIPLAYDKASFNVAVIPFEIKKNKEAFFKKISEFLSYDINSIYKNYNREKENLFSPVNIIVDIEKKTALYLKEAFGNDILINPKPKRFYPYPYEFAHILGYVKEVKAFYKNLKKYGYTPHQRAGFLGVEQYYDTYLKGEEGGDLIEVDAKGKVVGFLGTKISQKGRDIYLTLDYKIQKLAYESLKGKRGAIILMDSKKGDIICMVSTPSFNLNHFTEGRKIERVLKSKYSPLINRAIQATYPLGSTFKPIVAAAALEEGVINENVTFNCKGKFKIGEEEFKCWNIHGEENIYQALAHSCNVYFYNIGIKLGPYLIAKWAKRFGLDSLSEIDLPYEKKGFIPTPSWKKKKLKMRWFDGDTLNMSIGQGFVEATPLEVLLAINVFANEGYLIKPYLLRKIGNIESIISTKVYVGISKETLDIIKKSLREAVKREDGTAHILERLGLQIAGKTGTAQTRGKPHGWFVGFFPYENPKYTICVFLEHAGSSYEALKVTYYFLKKLKEENLL